MFPEYLKQDGFHNVLNCPNVMRCLEATQIMKGSQSSTERVMSHVAKTVRGRFEPRQQYNSSHDGTNDTDSVNREVIIQCNEDMATIDKARAYHNFTAKHSPMLQQSKLLVERSTTVTDLLQNLKSTENSTIIQREKHQKVIKSSQCQSAKVRSG